MAAPDILRFEDVVAGYGKQTILHGLSFNVLRGAITTIIGPNGAGTSTAFKASFGMLPVRAGRIFFDVREITNRAPRELIAEGICYVPQGRNIFSELPGTATQERRSLIVKAEPPCPARAAQAIGTARALRREARERKRVYPRIGG